jgi:hypothetical protein
MRAKFPNGHCLQSWVWLALRDSDLNDITEGLKYIDFVSFEEFDPHLIRSGLNFGKQRKFSGFSSSMNYDFTNVFNVFTIEWTKDFIYWKLNGKQYHREFINRYFEFENGKNYNKIRKPFDGKYEIAFTISCVPINGLRVDKNGLTNPYLFIDYIKIYYSSDSQTHASIENNTEILKNTTIIAENGSKLNDSEVIKYGIIGFLALFLATIIFFCFVLYFIKKRTSITKTIIRANSNDYKTTKRDDFRESFDSYDDNNENDYYAIVESLDEGEDSTNLNDTYLELT